MSDENALSQRPSRRAKKRAVAVYEALAQELADMALRQFAQLEVPEVLRAEVDMARRTRGNASRKRQTKYLAGFLRRHEEETQILVHQVESMRLSHHADRALFHNLEGLRDRLCQADLFATALHEAADQFPGIDVERLTRLAQRVQAFGDRATRREIFRLLREAQIRSA